MSWFQSWARADSGSKVGGDAASQDALLGAAPGWCRRRGPAPARGEPVRGRGRLLLGGAARGPVGRGRRQRGETERPAVELGAPRILRHLGGLFLRAQRLPDRDTIAAPGFVARS